MAENGQRAPAPGRTRRWKPLKALEACCLHCGDSGEVFTDQSGEYFTDGDEIRCVGCGCPGTACADQDEAWFNWHDEPDCKCSWCLAIRYTEAQHAGAAAEAERLVWMIATNCFVVRSRSVISPEQYIVVQGLDRDNVLGSGETARAAIDNARGVDG